MAAACESGPDSTLHVSSLVELEHGFLRDSGLQQMVRDYYASGADDECTLADNRAQYGRFKLLPRMLRDVSSVDMSVNILGAHRSAWMLAAGRGCVLQSDSFLVTATQPT